MKLLNPHVKLSISLPISHKVLVDRMAKKAGMKFSQVIAWLIENQSNAFLEWSEAEKKRWKKLKEDTSGP